MVPASLRMAPSSGCVLNAPSSPARIASTFSRVKTRGRTTKPSAPTRFEISERRSMGNDFLARQDGNSRLHFVYRKLRQTMAEILLVGSEEITPDRAFCQLCPLSDRWEAFLPFQESGFLLPNSTH